jgi:hypothetical protein
VYGKDKGGRRFTQFAQEKSGYKLVQNEVVSGSKRPLKGRCKERSQSHLKTYEWQNLVAGGSAGRIDAGDFLVEIGQASGTRKCGLKAPAVDRCLGPWSDSQQKRDGRSTQVKARSGWDRGISTR